MLTNHRVPATEPSDEELVLQLAAGQQQVLGPLYRRYARLVFRLAAESLDRSAAEEIVQDVFLEVWRKAAAFDPQQGSFRPWVLQLAHWRILNELRRRGRRPRVDAALELADLVDLPDPSPTPEEVVADAERQVTLRRALDCLPAGQRQALGLAFFGELTHEQVASRLGLPLGTAKTRIRAGVQSLRAHLAPVAAALAMLAVIGAAAAQDILDRAALDRDERAVALLTTSDIPDRRLVPAAPGLPAEAHGHYRGRAGNSLAVLNVSSLPAAPEAQVYAAWAHLGGRWLALGKLRPDSSGAARLIAEAPELSSVPDAVTVTLEPSAGSPSPTGRVMLAWPAPE